MKSLGMNKVLGTIKRRTTGLASSSSDNVSDVQADTPEAKASLAVKQFCTADPKSGDEVLFLPTIVDSAESSPAAAAECARIIRKFLAKEYAHKPMHQYNAIMLVRILSDNPGPTFTRNFDKKFVDAVRELLKATKNPSVRQILVETLDTFEFTKVGEDGLDGIVEMWKKEKDKIYKSYGYMPPRNEPTPRRLDAPPFSPNQQHQHAPDTHFPRDARPSALPDAVQMAARLEEARTSAKLLDQFVTASTPQTILDDDLIKEFAGRCQTAMRSVQGYMQASDPGPDNDTMESLIDVNEQLQAALNTHQRAVLGARKKLGIEGGTASGTATPSPRDEAAAPHSNGGYSGYGRGGGQGSSSMAGASSSAPPPGDNGVGRSADMLPPREVNKGKGAATYEPSPVSPSDSNLHPEDPFRDPDQPERGGPGGSGSAVAGSSSSSSGAAASAHAGGASGSRQGDAFAGLDSFHPGFQPAGPAGGSRPDWLGPGQSRKDPDDDDIYSSR